MGVPKVISIFPFFVGPVLVVRFDGDMYLKPRHGSCYQ